MKSQSRDIVEDVDGQSKITDAPIKIATDTVQEKETKFVYVVRICADSVIDCIVGVFTKKEDAEKCKSGIISNMFNTGTSHTNPVSIEPVPFNFKVED